jgi:cobalt-zinc-cadmium efflux system outer membrane protein
LAISACLGWAAAAPAATLAQAFDTAWARQPEAQALAARRDAAHAQRAATQQWLAQPLVLEAALRSDRLTGHRGAQELELGLAATLWLPGERARSQALADAELAALGSRQRAAQWRLAGQVRDAWWTWQRARAEAALALANRDGARRLAADVARRVRAGDLARADQHQADGAVALAEGLHAHATGAVQAAALQLAALTGVPPVDAAAQAEPSPTPAHGHALLAEWQDKLTLAERSAALLATQARAQPELTLATTRDRGAHGERSGQTLTLGLRYPLGGGVRHDAKRAAARADTLEAQAQLALERTRLQADGEAARARTEAARETLAAAQRRSRLVQEARGFFDKAFRLGEADLPTRLRIEAEATEAERHEARAAVELAAAVSAWRQALGLLPQ